jgi:hypothetical protein
VNLFHGFPRNKKTVGQGKNFELAYMKTLPMCYNQDLIFYTMKVQIVLINWNSQTVILDPFDFALDKIDKHS